MRQSILRFPLTIILNSKPNSAASATLRLNSWNTRVGIFSNHLSSVRQRDEEFAST